MFLLKQDPHIQNEWVEFEELAGSEKYLKPFYLVIRVLDVQFPGLEVDNQLILECLFILNKLTLLQMIDVFLQTFH